jgi:hypothetical protein
MTTSGTFNFNPGFGELILYAYQMIGIRPTAILQEHMISARTAANLMLARWSNLGVNLWQVDLVTVPIVANQSTYDVDPTTVLILDMYAVTSNMDRIMLPISRTEYASYPNKEQTGTPTVFWFDRTLSPTVTIWPVPDGNNTTEFKYYRMRRSQDTVTRNNKEIEIPYIWMEAFADGLAYRLSKIWAPQMSAGLKADADSSYQIAAERNIENATTYISPMIGGYYRQ